jgi:cyclohexanone monooxygenase
MNIVWTEECRSWYKAGSIDGKILALWPGSTLHYLETAKTPRFEDWNFKYSSKNRFTYLGNGHSTAEQPGGNISYYIRNKDDSPIDPILKKPVVEEAKAAEQTKEIPDLFEDTKS